MDLGYVVDELNLPLGLRQRAVALINVQSISQLIGVYAARIFDLEVRHTGGVRLIQVQAWDACICGGRGSIAIRYVEDVIPHVSQPEFIDQGRIDRVGPTYRKALVPGFGTPRIVAEPGAAGLQAESSRRLL